MGFLASKTARVGILYVLLCALALAFAQRERLGSCIDWRLAVLRELTLDDTRAPDVVFLGSSRTVRGIRPLVAEEVFAASGGALHSALDLGTNGLPRHMNAITLAAWLARHPAPKIVCVEVGDIELDPYPHQLLGNIATPRDALELAIRAPYFIRARKDYAAQVPLLAAGKAFDFERQMSRRHWHLELALQILGRGPEDVVRTAFNCLANAFERPDGETFWSGLAYPYWAADPPIERRTLREQLERGGWYQMDPENELLRTGRTLIAKRAAEISVDDAISKRRDQQLRGNRMYAADVLATERITRMCREHGIRLVFYYLPPFRDEGGQISTDHEQFIREQGELYWPDLRELLVPENYADTGHLSDLGAERYTRALAAHLAR